MRRMISAFDRAGLLRGAALICVFLTFLVLVRGGFRPPMRPITLLAVDIAACLALAYELYSRDLPESGMLWSLAGVSVACLAAYVILSLFDPVRPEWKGPLMSGHAPTPRNACSGDPRLASQDHLLMLSGQDGVIGQGAGPFTPVRIGSCPALSIRRDNGGLMIDAFGYDADDNVVYRIRDNVFEMVLRGFLREDRAARDTLRIVDDKGRPWLEVDYLNRNTVRVLGSFGCGDTRTVLIGDTDVRSGGMIGARPLCATMRTGEKSPLVYQSAP